MGLESPGCRLVDSEPSLSSGHRFGNTNVTSQLQESLGEPMILVLMRSGAVPVVQALDLKRRSGNTTCFQGRASLMPCEGVTRRSS